MSKILELLVDAVGANVVISGDEMDRATSYWDATPTQAVALARPKTTEQVSKILAICNEHGHPVITQGGLTNCVHSAEAQKEEIILSLERMNEIESIDITGGTATVGAGVILQTLQEACLEQDMLFPLDLGARGSCTVGGNVATNAGGINVLRYGMARQLVLGLEAVMADGTVLSSMNQMLKNNSAYDLKQLFIGTEGTLGVITRINVRIFPKPTTTNAAMLALQDFDSVTKLLNRAQRDLAGNLSAFEVMWGDHYRAVTVEGANRSPMSRDYNYYIMMETEGGDTANDEAGFMSLLESCFEEEIIIDAVIPKSESERIALWDIRENFEAILEPKPIFLYDVSLPIIEMDNYINTVEQQLKDKWTDCEFYVLGHIADGNLHFFIRPNDKADKTAEQLHYDSDEIVYGELQKVNGAVSAEHGIGMEKRAWLKYSRSEEEIKLMKLLKRTLDTNNILNRGRVLGDL
ncbi:FAD-binding oxidoreductase [Thalassotalea psychrophila]|uniref:FAD-binding oxidoreductase n=1 Tax=Thalassotalea psychrophila TaxID=3065647 RepID=A0ABY9TYT4_9GAMM|nr:FAD-binding oxidoreductase [Colwelliaceae bacterium SQ149]